MHSSLRSFVVASFHTLLRCPSCLVLFLVQDEHAVKGKIEQLKSLGRKATEKRDYFNDQRFTLRYSNATSFYCHINSVFIFPASIF
jgi:hypothetical protein